MIYFFKGGPLRGETRDIADSEFKDGRYQYVQWGKYSSPFALLPSMILHYYTPVGDSLLWVEPDKLVK